MLQRIEFYDDEKIACLVIDPSEIKKYSSNFNPTVILDEMKTVNKVNISLGFKQYIDFKTDKLIRITLRIRCHHSSLIAQELAQEFGGGGHPYAAGVKWENDNLDLEDIKNKVIKKASELLKLESNK